MIERFNVAPPGMFNRQVRQYLYSPLVVVPGGDLAHILVAGKTATLPDGRVGSVGDLRGRSRWFAQASAICWIMSGPSSTTWCAP